MFRSRLALLVSLLLAAGAVPACSPRAPEPPRPAVASPGKRLGFSVLEDYDKGDDLQRVEADFRIIRDLGVRTWRGSFGWDDYEPQPGVYDFDWLIRFVRAAAKSGIELRPYVGYTPEWAAARGGGADHQAWNDPPRDPARWEAFVAHLAAALRDEPNVRSYEIYNEENAPLWWEGTPAEYAAALGRASAAIRRADPDAQVVIGGFTFPDTRWLEAVCETAGQAHAFDIAAFHAYPETWTPDSVVVENYLDRGYRHDYLGTLRGGCAGQPVWINEAGYATTPGRTERQQASWWARAVATFAADSAVQHIGIYEIRDQRRNTPVIGNEPNYYLGLLREDGRKKLAYNTVRLLVRLLGGAPFVVRDTETNVDAEPAGRDIYHHLFDRADGTQVLVIWTRDAPAVARVDLPRRGARATSYTLAGKASAYPLVRGRRLERLRLEPGDVRIIEVARE